MGRAYRRRGTTNYAASGVDRRAVASALGALLSAVKRRPRRSSRGGTVAGPGHFAGLVRAGDETIAVTTDTVGTKVLLAERLRRWEGIGRDVVAVNLNDLAAVGATPLGFVDTILCVRPDPAVFRALGRGMGAALGEARCPLLGGESAVVGEIVRSTDVGGTAVGYFPRGSSPVLGTAIRPGDRILGLRSSGVHANGFTLVRRLLAERRVNLRRPRPGGRTPVGVELLAPTRLYTEAARVLSGWAPVHGLAHISGGGVRNLARLHPSVAFDLDGWPTPPPLFRWLAELGGISDREMIETFNMGVGFAAVVSPAAVGAARHRLARAGFGEVLDLGRVVAGRGVEVPRFHARFDGYA